MSENSSISNNLSSRENNLMILLTDGVSKYDISNQLEIDEDTLEIEINILLHKLNLRNLQDLKYYRLQLNEPESKLKISSNLFSSDEIDVLELLVDGKTRQDISKELSISEGTVRTRINVMLYKVNLKNSAELTRYVFENNLIVS